MPFKDGYIVCKTWRQFPDKQTTELIDDDGDSLAENGRYHHLRCIRHHIGLNNDNMHFSEFSDFRTNLYEHLQKNGKLIRGPTWWPDPKDVSRDQIDPNVMAAAAYKATVCLSYINNQLNHFTYPNGDLVSPEHLSHFFRFEGTLISRAFSYFADLFLLLNSIIIVVRGRFSDSVENDLNHIHSMFHAKMFYPTFISRLATKIYFYFRDAQKVLEKYYTIEGGNIFLIELYVKPLRWLSGKVSYE